MKRNRRIAVALLVILAAAPFQRTNAAEEKEKGWFGLAFSVETEGFSFNPTVQSVRIDKVAPSSPAAAAGLAAGDVVVAAQGVAIAGAKADDLKAVMKKSVGDTLRLKVRRGGGEPFEVPLVAIARPSGA